MWALNMSYFDLQIYIKTPQNQTNKDENAYRYTVREKDRLAGPPILFYY